MAFVLPSTIAGMFAGFQFRVQHIVSSMLGSESRSLDETLYIFGILAFGSKRFPALDSEVDD